MRISVVIILLLTAQISHAYSYKSVVEHLTERDEVFSLQDFRAIIIWSATPVNDILIAAQAELYAEKYNLRPAERNDFAQKIRMRRGREMLFFVSFYSHDRRYNDLTKKKANWKLKLTANGRSYEPSRIEKVSKPTPLEKLFFPYLDQWSKGYYIWFPLKGRAARLQLSVHGPEGSSELVFKQPHGHMPTHD